ncbi:branched-chain amino acid ABC transporter permease/ATP-binding protein [Pseudonocardia pini]|uniref:branched-chain amino acid ABC transporter permease/ATP-binding protein n=1 Tax=Pseudonocardia pini TaxID=2758030 RepID=UPI0015F01B08|nr:branched-chain amino acid ABC transporter permease/ATP-binding protein [Pseudonocardia pini]
MTEILPFLVIGLTTGSVYGLAGVGLVLTYKTSGVLNFAHGALATVAAYLLYTLFVEEGMAWPVSAVLAVVVAGPLMGLLLAALSRTIARTSFVLQVAATAGLLLAILAAIELIFGLDEVRTVPVFLGAGTVDVAGTTVQWSSIWTFLVTVCASAALAVYFRLARTGLAMRAVVARPELLSLTGTSPTRVRTVSWVIGTTFAATSGVLLAPVLPLEPTNLTLLVLSSFGAAALAAFRSIPLTFVGGLVIGIVGALATRFITDLPLLGLAPAMPYLVLLLVLVTFPRRYFANRAEAVSEARATWTAPPRMQLGSGAVVLVVLCLVPLFAGIHLTDWTTGLATVVLFLSLGLLVKTSGQVSLAHVTFAVIGAVTFQHLVVDAELPWSVGVLLAGLVVMPIGALLAFPAARLSSLYLALATFAFAVVVQYVFYRQDYMFGPVSEALAMPKPDLGWTGLEPDTAYFYLVLVLAVLAALLVILLSRSRLGRLLRAMADSPVAVGTSGTSVLVTRGLVFAVSAGLAGFAGALAGVSQGAIAPISYPPLLSLTYFALIVVVPGREPWNALLAGLVLIVVPSYLSGGDVPVILELVFGLSAVAYAAQPAALRTLPPKVTEAVDRLFRRAAPPPVPPAAGDRRRVRPGELEVRDLTVRFGGLLAVQDLSLRAATGGVTALIGPNGAGKTTTFNACTGLVRPSAGSVLLDGRPLGGRTPAARARLGLGRTFQRMELYESLTVRRNVESGMEAALAGIDPLRHVFGGRRQRAEVAAATAEALELCDIVDLADRPVSLLSTGQRRLVEMARCVAGPSRIMLLDEPSSGLDEQETAAFARIVRRVVAERGVGVLLVEHDMDLVLDLSDQIYVMDFGRLVARGTPQEVLASDIVRAAYLGEGDVPVAEAVEDSTAEGSVVH